MYFNVTISHSIYNIFNINTYNINTYNINTYNINTYNINAYNINTYNINTRINDVSIMHVYLLCKPISNKTSNI